MPVGRKEAFSIQLLQLTDAALVWLAFYVADVTRNPIREILDQSPTEAASLAEMSWTLYVAVPFTPLALEFLGFYRRLRSKSFAASFSQAFRALLIMALMLGMLSIFARLPDTSRYILGIGGVFVLVFLVIRDRLVTAHLKRRGIRQDLKERVLIAASEEDSEHFLSELDQEELEALNIVGRFDLGSDSIGKLYKLFKNQSVERVIIAAGGTGFDKVAECVEACELQGIETWVAASFMRTQVARPTFDVLGDRPMLVLRSTPELSWELALKAVFDRVGAFLILLISMPFWIVICLGIKLSSSGPVFFSQERAGKYGRPFRMWKFRTMVPDADKLLDDIKESHGNEMEGPVFKLDRDPRVFPFGAFLRKFSIDEWPQFVNVLVGDMSLVGPRPLPVYEVEAFQKSEHRRRLSVKPGITCEWQCGGRNTITSFDEWVEMDLRYIDNWSMWLDIKLLLKTVPAVLFGWGAK